MTNDKDTHMDIDKSTEQDLAQRSHGNPIVVNDPASDLVDTDPAHDTPASPTPRRVYEHGGYLFSGGNLGGQAVFECLDCHGMIQELQQDNHAFWHNTVGV